MIKTLLFFFLFLSANILSVPRAISQSLVCGIAEGYPPYQFSEKGDVRGFDADVARLLFKKMNRKFNFFQKNWDDVFGMLRIGEIDIIVGMEVNDKRRPFFDFTREYYHRHDVVFVREDNHDINSIEDLYDQIITGDRNSYIEIIWEKKGIKDKIRVMQAETKEKSMQLLFEGKTKAAIMPEAVGYYLAKKIGLKLRILDSPDPGSPVAIAVKKGNKELHEMADQALKELIDEGEIKRLYREWFLQ